MEKITVDFAQKICKPKPMHATNNGPAHKPGADKRYTNFDAFVDAGIPYARNHDASFCTTYGINHTVDVDFIFTDWNADPYDPSSYDFACTDAYVKANIEAGVKVFYRLGSRIEHEVKKYNTRVPVDYKKWAVVCEHIIRHYNEGWCDGMYADIEYWEIWNEPDLDSDDSANKRCWQGTAKQFYEFFKVALEHLKTAFPHLKIGGPAVANAKILDWAQELLDNLDTIKPDFFSWHVYGDNTEKFRTRIRNVRAFLDKNGMQKTESILNEWNYVKAWSGEKYMYSFQTIKNLKGSSFTSAIMLMSTYEPLDMLMYYDARPGTNFNGMFSCESVTVKRKGYYPFYMYNQLYKQEQIVAAHSTADDIYCAAASGEEQNAMLTYFNDDEDSQQKSVEVNFKNVSNSGKVRLECYVLDENSDCKLSRSEIFTSNEFSVFLNLKNYTTLLLKIIKE